MRRIRERKAEGGRRKDMAGFVIPHGEQAHRLNDRRRPSRRGFSILEVLVSMAILLIGLIGVAALIPIGKLSMIETNKSDRTGACGRAALRDVKIRRMLDPDNWEIPTSWTATPPTTFVLDPLGYTSALGSATVGGGTATCSQRINLKITGGTLTAAKAKSVAQSIFNWQDDLIFDTPTDSSLRPRPIVKDSAENIGPYPSLTSETPTLTAPVTQQYDGNFSWFLTVTASPSDVASGLSWAQRREFTVSAVVCWKRAINNATSEKSVAVVCDAANGIGGIGISYPFSSTAPMPKEDQWVLLASTNVPVQSTWYRVVSIGNDGDSSNPTIRATLVGPDWNSGQGGTVTPVPVAPNGTVNLIVIEGVTGVYTTTIQLDQ